MIAPRFRLGVALAVCLSIAVEGPARACGPFIPQAVFWFTSTPNEPLERFLDGHFGILDQDLGPPYRFVVYRYLAGVGLDEASRAALAPYWSGVPGGTDPYDRSAVERWIEARQRVGGQRRGEIDPWRRVSRQSGGEVTELSYRNCLDDAFDTAVKTLARLTVEYGGDSPLVSLWAEAQDQVFANCDKGPSIPVPLGDESSAAMKADRDYQIAAAYFYAGDYGEAEARFRGIAVDPSSPWRALSSYLVGRVLLRRGMLTQPTDTEALRAAEAQFRAIAETPDLSALHPAANRLRAYVALRVDPVGLEGELETALLRPTLDPDAVQQLIDYQRAANTRPAGAPASGLARWLADVSCEDCPGALPMANRLADAVRSDGALATAMPGPETGAARPTLAYDWARHLLHAGDTERARAVLDDLLAGGAGELALGDRNRVLAARAPLATSLDEYLRLSQLVPVGVRSDEYTPAPLDPQKQPVLLSDETLAVLDGLFSPSLLARALESRQLAPGLERRIAIFAWVKAHLSGDDAVAMQLVPIVRRAAPEMRADLDAYAGSEGDARRFAFALASLRFPGARPFAGRAFPREMPIEKVDSFGDNWWCGGAYNTPDVHPPAFLTPAELEAAAATKNRMRSLEPAPQLLGAIVFAWADAHPDDPRVPEALHRVVKSTRYSHCGRGDGGETSQRAFLRLHRQYPNSPWTEKTPYWFSWG